MISELMLCMCVCVIVTVVNQTHMLQRVVSFSVEMRAFDYCMYRVECKQWQDTTLSSARACTLPSNMAEQSLTQELDW